jgi:hypothetical protein
LIVCKGKLLHLVFFDLQFTPLHRNLILSHPPFLVHPVSSLLRGFSFTRGIATLSMMVLWILTLGGCPIWMERMIFFELLVEQVFLPDLLSLLDFMILVQTLKCCIFIISFNIGRRCSLGDAFWMKSALTQFHMVF